MNSSEYRVSSRKGRKFFFSLLVTFCSLLLLNGCGFHLRGSVNPVHLPPTFVAGPAGPLQQEVLRYLAISKVLVVEDQKEAQLTIHLLNENVQRRVLSVGSNGKVQEYEVRYQATYSAVRSDGQVVIAPETLEQMRSYTYDQSAALAKDTEQDRLVQDMRRDVVRRMMRRLQAAIGKQS